GLGARRVGPWGPGAEAHEPDVALVPGLLRLYTEGGGEGATGEGHHEPPASKRMAERFASDRVGHRPPMENARLAGSLAETEPTLMASLPLAKSPKVEAPPCRHRLG